MVWEKKEIISFSYFLFFNYNLIILRRVIRVGNDYYKSNTGDTLLRIGEPYLLIEEGQKINGLTTKMVGERKSENNMQVYKSYNGSLSSDGEGGMVNVLS